MKTIASGPLSPAVFAVAFVLTGTATARAAMSDSVVQFKVGARPVRLSHDMKILWSGALTGSQCTSVTVTPKVDTFPGGSASL